jgi:hypothetical protein
VSSADFKRAVAELRERVATAHLRQPCALCHAPTGTRCRRMGKQGRVYLEQPIKFAHAERLVADGITVR